MTQTELMSHVRDLRTARDLDVHAEEVDENAAMQTLITAGISLDMIELLVNRQRLVLSKTNAANEWDSQLISRKILKLNAKLSDMATEAVIGEGIRFELGIMRINPTTK